MPRAATKKELISSSDAQFTKMWNLVDTIPELIRQAPFNFQDLESKKGAHWKRDKNLRDVFIHLYEWQQMLINWIESNTIGEPMPFLPPPYNWKNYQLLNVSFWEKHQNTPYQESVKMLTNSHEKTMKLIDGFSNEELFTKNHFSWAGATTLGSYCVSATASHYDWAVKKIKAYIKTLL